MLVEGQFTIEKMPGKGGWHYVLLPDIKPDAHAPFGWRNVFGYIDDFEINNYNLQPFGNGYLFLPINAKIRKLIKKEKGEQVYLKLYQSEINAEDRSEIEVCFAEDQKVIAEWQKLNETAQEKILADIFRAKTADEKAQRILNHFEKLAQ